MTRCLIILVLFAALFSSAVSLEEKQTVWGGLKEGDLVNLKDTGVNFHITVIESEELIPQPHTVLEVHDEFIVVRDFVGINKIRIPVTSVKAVVFFKIPQFK